MAYRPSVTDRELVTALRAGDRLAAGQIYDIYGTRLYAYCHELLGDHKLAGDALRDAFIVAVNRIRELRSPDELGAWLYALSRAECERIGVSEEIPQDAGDAARGDRLARLALDCYAMLPPETREVLDLAFRHRLVDADLARVLGVPEEEASAKVGAAQTDLEHTLLVVLAARTGDPKCPEAAELGRKFDQLDGRGVDAWVQSVTRHIEKCTICSTTVKNRRPLRLFEELPHSFMPPGVRSRVLESLRDPAGAAFAARISDRAGRFDEDGFPVAGKRGGAGSARKWVLPLGFAAAAAAVAVLGYVMIHKSPATTPTANSTSGQSVIASGTASATDSSTSSDVTLGTGSASASASVSASTSTSTATTKAATTARATTCVTKPTTTPAPTTTVVVTTSLSPVPVTSTDNATPPNVTTSTATATVTITSTKTTTYPSPTTYKSCS